MSLRRVQKYEMESCGGGGARGRMDGAGLLFMQHERCRGEASGTTQTAAAVGGDEASAAQQENNLHDFFRTES